MFLRTDHIPKAKPSMAPAAVPNGLSSWKRSSISYPQERLGLWLMQVWFLCPQSAIRFWWFLTSGLTRVVGDYDPAPTVCFLFERASTSEGILEDFNEAIASALDAAFSSVIFLFLGAPMRKVPSAFAPASTES